MRDKIVTFHVALDVDQEEIDTAINHVIDIENRQGYNLVAIYPTHLPMVEYLMLHFRRLGHS